MREQKYYVKLKIDGQILIKFMRNSAVFVEDDGERNEYNEFTKSELAEIMDGAFYNQTLAEDCIPVEHVYYGDGKGIVSEWINPLIELVPVEGSE